MTECVIYEVRFTRKLMLRNGNVIESGFTIYEPIDANWDKLDVTHWTNFKFSDLIDAGWDARIERVESCR